MLSSTAAHFSCDKITKVIPSVFTDTTIACGAFKVFRFAVPRTLHWLVMCFRSAACLGVALKQVARSSQWRDVLASM